MKFTTNKKQSEEKKKAKIRVPRSLNEFSFMYKGTEYPYYIEKLMLEATQIKSNINGQPLYRCNPYKIELNQVKIFLYETRNEKFVSRCKVIDIYTKPTSSSLVAFARVFKMDRGGIYDTKVDNLYDFPLAIRHYQNLPQSAYPAKIYKQELANNTEANNIFQKFAREHKFDYYDVEVVRQLNGFYYIDLYDNNKSFVDYIERRVSNQPKVFQNGVIAQKWIIDPLPSIKQTLQPYKGFFDYYTQYCEIKNSEDHCIMNRQLMRAKLLSWTSEDSIYILPADRDYLTDLRNHQKKLDKIFYNQRPNPDRTFREGDLVVFKSSQHRVCGLWLRGRILDVLKTDEVYINLSAYLGPKYNIRACFSNRQQNANTCKIFAMTNFPKALYKVQSIDYGFSQIKSPDNMIYLKESHPVRKGTEPWSLRCKLFGIRPTEILPDSRTDSIIIKEKCDEAIDSWVSERYVDKIRDFFVLFKSQLSCSQNLLNLKPTFINLFYKKMTGVGKKFEYECLPAHLTSTGYFKDTMGTSKEPSQIDLDQIFINQLIEQETIYVNNTYEHLEDFVYRD